MSGTVQERVYLHKQIETMDLRELKDMQLKKLKAVVDRALRTEWYAGVLGKAGIRSGDDIRSLDDLRKIPFTAKNDLRDAFPSGLLSVDRDEIVRIHASSGTTGIPTVIYHTQGDLDNWTALTARSLTATGCTKKDVLQNMMSYGLFTGGLGVHYAAESIGMMVVPAGSGNTQRQFKLMKDFQTTTVHATPSYMLHLHSKMEDFGIRREDLKLARALVGAEPHSEDIRKKIEHLYGIDVYNSYGLSEMNGPGVAFECTEKQDMHLWEDAYIMEIINPETLEPVKEGETGELVLTTLDRVGTPILRYRTRDLTSVNPRPCPCGRTHRRIRRIIGRSDDMLIINGVNVFPSQIEEVIMGMNETGTNYQIVIEKNGALDRMIVKTEVSRELFSDNQRDLERLKQCIQDNLAVSISIKPKVELHQPGVLPVSEGKAVRVIDNR
ncbi:MAG: phenylacetate--CoA ligase [Spirochaetales bacterium]|nr:phenylacetate--CoA ligase [Spirochaetales bacterium]